MEPGGLHVCDHFWTIIGCIDSLAIPALVGTLASVLVTAWQPYSPLCYADATAYSNAHFVQNAYNSQ